MKPTFIVLVLLASVARSQTQISCSDYGQAIYCSNGLSAIRAENTLYFSDGTLAQTFGNTTTIQNQPVQISSSNASTSYAAGQVIGGMVGGIIVEVRQRRKFDRICVGSGLLVAERQFRKIQGYREIPALLTALANAVSKKTVVEQGKVA